MERHDLSDRMLRTRLRTRPSRRARGDDGVTIVIVALSMVALMIFCAFVVDLGLVFSERRVDQNSADSAATSGAVVFVSAGTLQSAVDEVTSKVNTDLNRTVANSAWTACTDPAKPASYTRSASSLGLTPATPCISFNSTFTKMRVKLPNQTVSSVFGKVIGISNYTSSAFAEVGLNIRGGGALPFVVLAGNSPGDQICLRTDGTGGTEPPDQPAIPPYTSGFTQDPCNKNAFATAEGGRGTLNPWRYANCSQVGNQEIVDSIMVGMDHPLGVFNPAVTLAPGSDANTLDSSAQARIDGANSCGVANPNSVAVDTGLTSQLLHCALIERPCSSGSSATTNVNGRISVASTSGATFTGLGIDDVALWNYFVPTLPNSAPASCAVAKSSATTFYTRRAALMDCLKNWTSGQLFTSAVGDSPRFGYVPKVAELGLCRTQPNPPPPTGGCGGGPVPNHVHINNFAPVFIDGVYEDGGGVCDATNPAFIPPTSNWTIDYPGKGLKCGGSGDKKISRISGIVLPCGALPPDVCDASNNPPFPTAVGVFRVQLTR